MELILNNIKVNLKEGIDQTYFMANKPVASNDSTVRQMFLDHGFNLDEIDGVSAKIFTAKADEIEEIKRNLDKIVDMGLVKVFNANLKIMYFKDAFMARFEDAKNKGIPYLNEDNTFPKFFNSDDDYKAYLSSHNPVSRVTTNEIEKKSPNEEITMTIEDKQVYNEIIERLNYLVLGNPMDQELAMAVKIITSHIGESVMRKEYNWRSLKEMILGIIDEYEIADKERIVELIGGAFPDEERNVGK